MEFVKAFFGGSKKASMVLAGILLVLFRDGLGIDDDMAQSLINMIMAYLGSQGAVDVAKVVKGVK